MEKSLNALRSDVKRQQCKENINIITNGLSTEELFCLLPGEIQNPLTQKTYSLRIDRMPKNQLFSKIKNVPAFYWYVCYVRDPYDIPTSMLSYVLMGFSPPSDTMAETLNEALKNCLITLIKYNHYNAGIDIVAEIDTIKSKRSNNESTKE